MKAIAIDFDGCLCANKYPQIGEPHWNIINRAKQEQDNGAGLILWTCREGELLKDAIAACKNWGLHFDAINDSLPSWIEAFGYSPRKVGASEYWDDHAVNINIQESPWATAICQKAIDQYGKLSQLVVCMEEMSELTKELSKNIRGQDNDLSIAEEVADVKIMLDQIELIFNIQKDVAYMKLKKTIRLENRLKAKD